MSQPRSVRARQCPGRLDDQGAGPAGIQRTAAFAEYGWTRLDGFKSAGVMTLNDRAWRFGMSVEF